MKTQILNDLGALIERLKQLKRYPLIVPFGHAEGFDVGEVLHGLDELEAAIKVLPPAQPQGQESHNSELDRLKAEIEDWKSFVEDCDNTAVAREINTAILCLRDAVNGEYSREDRIIHDALGQGIDSLRINEDLKRKIAARELHIQQLIEEKACQRQTYRAELAAYSNTVESFKRRAEQAEAKLAASPPAQETKMPWSAHASHTIQENGCVRCGTVAREFAITLKCPYDSPVAASPQKQERPTNVIPRRVCINKLVPAELKIREAMLAVEETPADVRLTEAVVLLQRAREKVADFVDGVAPSSPAQEQEPPAMCRFFQESIDAGVKSFDAKSVQALLDAVKSALPPSHGWQQIETYKPTPDVFEGVLVAVEGGVGEANFHGLDGWWWVNNHPTDAWGSRIYPTHWMPLPDPPPAHGGHAEKGQP